MFHLQGGVHLCRPSAASEEAEICPAELKFSGRPSHSLTSITSLKYEPNEIWNQVAWKEDTRRRNSLGGPAELICWEHPAFYEPEWILLHQRKNSFCPNSHFKDDQMLLFLTKLMSIFFIFYSFSLFSSSKSVRLGDAGSQSFPWLHAVSCTCVLKQHDI